MVRKRRKGVRKEKVWEVVEARNVMLGSV